MRYSDEEPVILPQPRKNSIIKRVRWHIDERLGQHAGPPKPQLPYPSVELYYWQAPPKEKKVNFGDELSRTIVELMLARKGATLMDSAPQNRHMVAIGSVLHISRENSVVWGTGVHGAIPEKEHRYRLLDVRAVRGPLTRRFLRDRGISVPEVYGDPGLLLPHLTNGRFVPSGEFDVGLVPNFHDTKHVLAHGLADRPGRPRLIDPLRSWDIVVADIMKHKLILASSLHGLVIAEAFGIPARYVRLTENEDILKYHDYYQGTGRQLESCKTIEEAVQLGGQSFTPFDPARLMGAFPYDLWGL